MATSEQVEQKREQVEALRQKVWDQRNGVDRAGVDNDLVLAELNAEEARLSAELGAESLSPEQEAATIHTDPSLAAPPDDEQPRSHGRRPSK